MDQKTTTERAYHFQHPKLYAINGIRVTDNLIQFRSIPYAQTPRRFARSILLHHLPNRIGQSSSPYDATKYGPCSIQPQNSIETDVHWNQLPEHPTREQAQDEDCLRLTLTCPVKSFDHALDRIPVVVFIHGGALMIGSGILIPTVSMRPY